MQIPFLNYVVCKEYSVIGADRRREKNNVQGLQYMYCIIHSYIDISADVSLSGINDVIDHVLFCSTELPFKFERLHVLSVSALPS